jgi:putative spermidine/putrescine transport system ATP-binding protein
MAASRAAASGHVVLEGLNRCFGTTRAIDGVSLAVGLGEFLALLGPSGCGKTTLLRLIAGLERPDSGRILLAGRDITATPTWERNVGLVFQSLALFPHMSVGENIAYGLNLRRRPEAEVRKKVAQLLDLLRLPGVQDRAVTTLSGGQKQRVAIARALALDPQLFLLDEPLSALDAQLREALQVELRLLQRELGITTVMVTHDQREAMTMADRVVVLHEGRIQQVGSPMEVYRNPVNAFVASFLGTSNLLPAACRNGLVTVAGTTFENVPGAAAASGEMMLSFRPEDLLLNPVDPAGLAAVIDGTVAFRRDLGAQTELHVSWGARTLIMQVPGDAATVAGHAVRVGFRASGARLVAR